MAKSPNQDKQDGTKGFSPQLGGNGKAGSNNTSSFDATKKETANSQSSVAKGQEEGGISRQPSTSSNG